MHTSADGGGTMYDQRTVFIGESGPSMRPEYVPRLRVDVRVARY